MYQHPYHIHDKVRNSVLITGSARSGTSIFGKLVGSLETVEYFFEPPTLVSLFSLLDDLPQTQARFLFDTFVYEDLLVGALSGRTINLRSQDDSSLRHTKTEAEIARRMQGAARKRDLDTRAASIAIKVPSFVYRIPEIVDFLQLHRLLILIRDPRSTLGSLLQRRWFSDTLLQAGDITWPNRFDTRVPAPHWVPRDRVAEWDTMTEADRAALYYITQTALPGKLPAGALVLDYNQLIAQPRALLEHVAGQLGLAFGPRSDALLDEVEIQDSTSQFDLGVLRQEFRTLLPEVHARAAEHCLKL